MRALRICTIIVGALVIVGAVMFWIIYHSNNTGDCVDMEMTVSAEVSQIQLQLRVHEITVNEWDGNEIRVRYTQPEKKPLTIKRDENTLSISDPHNRHFYFGGWGTKRTLSVAIDLPAGFFGDLILSTDTGSVRVEGLSHVEVRKAEIRTSTGSVTVKDCAFGTTELETSTGAVTVERLSCTSLVSRTSTGSQRHTELASVGDAEIKATTGSVEVNVASSTDGALLLQTTTGNIRAYGVRSATSLRIEATTGSIVATLRGTEQYYLKDCGSQTGSVKLPSLAPGGTVPLIVRTATGSIRVEAAD